MAVVNIKGNDIVTSHVTAVGKPTTIKTGSMICDWEYGFTITMTGGATKDIIVPAKRDSCGNRLQDRSEMIAEVEKVRQELIKEL